MLLRTLSGLLSAALIAGSAMAQDAKSVTAYVWGNSLIHHLSNSDNTTVPHWLALLAKADGRNLKLDGQWGFVRDFAGTLPPVPNWSFKQVKSAWNSERRSFDKAGFDTILLNPANFIQYQPPGAAYDGDPSGTSPVSATVEVFDWVRSQGVEPVFYIYEGWAELGQFPPTRRKYRNYTKYALGAYHDWFRAYHADVAAQLPGADVRLIPVGSLLSRLVTDGPLADLRPTDLYLDDAPHGTATTYFLAAMITYSAIYNAPPPRGFSDFGGVNEEILDHYPEIVDFIWAGVQGDLAPRQAALGQTEADEEQSQTQDIDRAETKPEGPRARAALPVAAAPRAELPPEDAAMALGLAAPSLAMGLNGIADWSTQHPFIDVMKTARPWVGHKEGQWGAVSARDLLDGGHLDNNGWPVSLPSGVTQIESFILTAQPEDMTSINTRYRMRWEGQGDITLGGIARIEQSRESEIWFSYKPSGDGLVAITIRDVEASDPIKNITIVREDHVDLFDAGVIYNPDFVAKIADLRSLRFMDWMFTNGSEKATWSDRARPEHYTFVDHGVPVEYIVHLSNLVGADPWVNMPHLADDDYMARYAAIMRDGLDPRLKIYVEYSNEVWNFIFPQAVYAREQAIERWGGKAEEDGWMQWAGMRSAQMVDIWNAVFEGQEDRLIPTMGVHSGWLGLEEPLFEAPFWVKEGQDAPHTRFKAYAVTGYFGFELGGEEHAPQIIDWIETAQDDARKTGEAQGLQRVALREFVKEQGLANLYPQTADLLRKTSIPELVGTIWPYHAQTAARYGMEMVMYEGGTHVAPHGEWSSNEALSKFMQDFNYSSEMAEIYGELLQAWKDTGGTLYNAFVDIAPPSQFGSWGALRHIDDSTARWDALIGFNEATPSWWSNRRSDAFLHGVLLRGTPNGDRVTGTTEEDILLGSGGDDELITLGGSDQIHGGPGNDVVILPGSFENYEFEPAGERLLAKTPGAIVSLFAVERLRFDNGEIAIADLL